MVVSDTNILGSFAATDALPNLFALLATDKITMPPAVEAEIRMGVARNVGHLQRLLDAISDKRLVVTPLNPQAQATISSFPQQLNSGEREAIALAAQYRAPLLTNDRRALSYCVTAQIATLDLNQLLRGLWVRKVVTQAIVRDMITHMKQVDRTIFLEKDLQQIFAPRRH